MADSEQKEGHLQRPREGQEGKRCYVEGALGFIGITIAYAINVIIIILWFLVFCLHICLLFVGILELELRMAVNCYEGVGN